jgi:hypothetical protein
MSHPLLFSMGGSAGTVVSNGVDVAGGLERGKARGGDGDDDGGKGQAKKREIEESEREDKMSASLNTLVQISFFVRLASNLLKSM